jgi:hypothetical protein
MVLTTVDQPFLLFFLSYLFDRTIKNPSLKAARFMIGLAFPVDSVPVSKEHKDPLPLEEDCALPLLFVPSFA